MLAPQSSSRLCSLDPLPSANRIDVANNKLAATPKRSGNRNWNPLPKPPPVAMDDEIAAVLGGDWYESLAYEAAGIEPHWRV